MGSHQNGTYHDLDSRVVMMAFTQADLECQHYMAISKGFNVQDIGQNYVLKQKTLFGQKQGDRQ
jgi:hypothetical protein